MQQDGGTDGHLPARREALKALRLENRQQRYREPMGRVPLDSNLFSDYEVSMSHHIAVTCELDPKDPCRCPRPHTPIQPRTAAHALKHVRTCSHAHACTHPDGSKRPHVANARRFCVGTPEKLSRTMERVWQVCPSSLRSPTLQVAILGGAALARARSLLVNPDVLRNCPSCLVALGSLTCVELAALCYL